MKKLIPFFCLLIVFCPIILQGEAQYSDFIDEKVIVIDNEGNIYKGILEKEMTSKIVLMSYGSTGERQFVDIEDIQQLKIDKAQNAKSTVNNVFYVVGVVVLLAAYLYLKIYGLPI